jgi:hypothetical protein
VSGLADISTSISASAAWWLASSLIGLMSMMNSSNDLRVDLVVLRVSADESDIDRREVVWDQCHPPPV